MAQRQAMQQWMAQQQYMMQQQLWQQQAYQQWLMQQENLKTDFAKSKVDWTSIATNEDFSKALLMLFKQRG